MIKLAVNILITLIIFSPGLSLSKTKTSEEVLFKKAISFEGRENFKKALGIYDEIISKYPETSYSFESFFRSGYIYDEKLNNPPSAIPFYEKYLEKSHGRNVRRARSRLKYISKYKNVDMKIYSKYIDILNYNDRKKFKEQQKMMEQFILENPSYQFLDEAIFWSANKLLGDIKKINTEKELKRVQLALNKYKRILSGFPDSDKRLMVLKKTGDCYRLLGKSSDAKKMYQKVYLEGGEKGKILVEKYMLLTNLSIWRLKFLKIGFGLFLFSGFFIFKTANLRKFNAKAIKKGILHSLFFIPFAAVPTGLAFFLTDASADNNTGREPYLLLTIMAVTLIVIFINGVIMEAEGNKKINYFIYTPLIVLFHISILYALFYYYNLLPYIERFFI